MQKSTSIALTVLACSVAGNAVADFGKQDAKAPPVMPEVQAVGAQEYTITIDPTGEAYPWIDATQGTRLTDAEGDDSFGQITWPFDFAVFDSLYSEGGSAIDVNSNGSAHFDPGGPRTVWVNCGDIPSDFDGQWVAPLGDDLVPGEVYFIVTGTAPSRILTIEWLNLAEFGGPGLVDLQVNLFEGSNTIVTQTRINAQPDFFSDGVIGINAGDAVRGQELGCGADGTLPSNDFDVEYSLSAPSNLGGIIAGADSIVLGCANLTDPQVATTNPLPLTLFDQWNCEALGVSSGGGDSVRVFASARSYTEDFFGQVTGMQPGASALCINETQGVETPAGVSESGAWSCSGSGLPQDRFDLIRVVIEGVAAPTD
jgi:hypothetical protein